MDVLESLYNKFTQEGLQGIRMGYLDPGESLVIYPMPGSQTIQEYQDGTSDRRIPFEIAYKSQAVSQINMVMWQATQIIENMNDLTSQDGTFEFLGSELTNLPFLTNLDEKGYYTYNMNFYVDATILNY